MIRVALVAAGGVVDCIYSCMARDATRQHRPDGYALVNCPDDVRVGWVYADGVFAPAPEPEVTVAQICSQRNALLLDTDWTQLPDVPAETSAAWAEYRQALRDAPANFEALGPDFEWPTPPQKG
jgi:hypothetical protein